LVAISIIGILIAVFITIYFKNKRFQAFCVSKFPGLLHSEPDYNSLLTDEDLYENALEDELVNQSE